MMPDPSTIIDTGNAIVGWATATSTGALLVGIGVGYALMRKKLVEARSDDGGGPNPSHAELLSWTREEVHAENEATRKELEHVDNHVKANGLAIMELSKQSHAQLLVLRSIADSLDRDRGDDRDARKETNALLREMRDMQLRGER